MKHYQEEHNRSHQETLPCGCPSATVAQFERVETAGITQSGQALSREVYLQENK